MPPSNPVTDTTGRLWPPYTPLAGGPDPLIAASTQGARIRLGDGRELIDGVSSWWTACHGYNHPAILSAMTDQLSRMPHVMFGGLTHGPAIELADRLCEILPGAQTRVFLSDSGSVAVEVAMKMAVQYWRNRGQAGRTKFVSFMGGYHGDTMAAMSVSDPDEGMHAMFAGYVPDQFVVPLPQDPESSKAYAETLGRNRDEIAAVLIEPILQAAGGMNIHNAETLRGIAVQCAALDIPLIVDEIATGFGRTGTLFACEQAGISPDIICVGKALTGGVMSLAATAANARIVDGFTSDNPDDALMHGPTYMANPLACAIAGASIQLLLNSPWQEQIQTMATIMAEELAPLRDLPEVKDVRVLGGIGVVEMLREVDVAWLQQEFIAQGVWLRPFGRLVYIMPPYIISNNDLRQLTRAMVTVLSAIQPQK